MEELIDDRCGEGGGDSSLAGVIRVIGALAEVEREEIDIEWLRE